MHISIHRLNGHSRPGSTRLATWPRLPKPSTWLALAAFALLALGSASAQETQRPLGSFLPDTTIAAFHFTPDASGHGFLKAVAGDLDLEAAGATVAKLGRLLGDEFGEDFDALLGLGLHGMLDGSFDEIAGELTEECPALHDALVGGFDDGLVGPTVLAVSMSRFYP